jgi:hypothetical protein
MATALVPRGAILSAGDARGSAAVATPAAEWTLSPGDCAEVRQKSRDSDAVAEAIRIELRAQFEMPGHRPPGYTPERSHDSVVFVTARAVHVVIWQREINPRQPAVHVLKLFFGQPLQVGREPVRLSLQSFKV